MEQLTFEDVPEPEEWRDAVGFEGFYQVSSLGRVRSFYRTPSLILSPSYSNSGGYALYSLSLNGKAYGRTAHRLVLEAFVGPCPEDQEGRHLDDNPRNNVLSNLAWGTSSENKADMIRNGNHYLKSRDRCVNGHLWTPENTRIVLHPDGSFKQRDCRACANDRTKKLREQRKRSGIPCTEDGCDDPQTAKGLCEMHYARQWRANRAKKSAPN